MKMSPPAYVRWFFVVLWMGVIFAFSHQAHSSEATAVYLGDFNVIVRKLGHISEFAVLFFLVRWALLGSKNMHTGNSLNSAPHLRQWKTVISDKTNLVALFISVLYAASDEWHQSFVPGRSACIEDVLLDSSAVLAAVFMTAFFKQSK